jgi:hypothetical protein
VSTLKQKLVTINKVKIMSKNIKDKAAKDWSLSLGTYPGILFGMRTYHGDTHSQTVFYLPFIDIAYEVEK